MWTNWNEGKKNKWIIAITDPAPPQSVPEESIPFDEDCEVFIRQIAESAAIYVFEVEKAGTLDPKLLEVVASIGTGKWMDPKEAVYAAFCDEYSVSGG